MLRYAVIVAGGNGTRMGGAVPKQFVEIGDDRQPVVMRALRLFAECDHLVLALPAAWTDEWERLCRTHGFRLPVEVSEGGSTRFESVAKALGRVPDGVLVAVHDAVRPFTAKAVIDSAFLSAERYGSGVPAVEVADSLRLIGADGGSRPLDRSLVRAVQTPQVFRSTELKRAYAVAYRPSFTDDASVWEAAGYETRLVPGNAENVKLTRPADWPLAEILLRNGPY